MGSLGLGAAGLAGCALAGRGMPGPAETAVTATRRPAPQPPLVEAGALTPVDRLYVQSYQPNADPVDRGRWQLQVGGQVRQPLALSWADLQGLEQVEQMHTLECIGNPVGGGKIGNLVWRGARLRDVLALADLDPAGDHLLMSGADDYFTCVPLALALDARSLIAFSAAGADLPHPHGFPARVLLPGVYGQKQPKWLTGLSAVTGPRPGTWERKGWSDTATVQINSRIDFPPHGGELPGGQDWPISGIAFADDSGVARVEVSVDAGGHWSDAELLPGPTTLAWTAWRWEWPAPTPGRYSLKARATSGQGQRQMDSGGFLADVFPNGSASMDTVEVTIV